MDNIEFNNINYKIREINLHEIGYVFISTESLNDALMTSDGDYVSDVAEKIDSLLYFFVPDDKISLTTSELEQFVMRETL